MTLLERAARALADSGGGTEHGWELYIDDARALLTAIREPTEAMSETAFRNGACGGHNDCWRAMIDAALEGA